MVGQLEAYGALKLFILSGGRVGSGGVEEKKKKRRKKRREGVEEKSGGSERGERRRNGGRVNCVYSKKINTVFYFLYTAGIYAFSTRRHAGMIFNV